MKRNLKIPYGVSDFKRLRSEGYYFVDKSAYIRTLELCGSFLFFVRPRRFGKSLFLSMLRCYYDLAEQENFDALFGDLDIGREPTENRNRYQVLTLDFSQVNKGRHACGEVREIRRQAPRRVHQGLRRELRRGIRP